jgi:hypothetical protein
MIDVLITDFSGMLEAEDFLPWLQAQEVSVIYRNWREMEGTNCYCDAASKEQILSGLPAVLPRLRWIDSGDYHYLSHLLALREKEPFHLVLLDHHPDNQEPAFGGVLSCGSWVKAMQEENGLLRSVLSIGPEGCGEEIPAGWLEERRGERVYVSLDKDIMGREWARTDWSQGSHTLEQVKGILGQLLEGPVQVAAVDICGGLSPEKGATPEDLRINRETNIELYHFINAYL